MIKRNGLIVALRKKMSELVFVHHVVLKKFQQELSDGTFKIHIIPCYKCYWLMKFGLCNRIPKTIEVHVFIVV